MIYIEIEDSLRGSCCWEHRQTSQFAKNPDLAQCSVEEESNKANIEEELSLRKHRKEIHQARPWRHWANGAGIGDLANTRVRE